MGTPKTVAEDTYFQKGFGMYFIPDQDFIYISKRFYSHWEHVIADRDILAVDPNGNSRQLKVGLKDGRPAFTAGVEELAEFYSLEGRTLVHFKYEQPLTFNMRIFRDNQYGPEIKYPGEPPVINLVSDSDSEPEAEAQVLHNEQATQWEKVVTSRIVDGRGPLHLPATVTARLRQNGMTRVHVKVMHTNLNADCEICPTPRSKNEAYLMSGWYGLCKDLKLAAGNKLKFTFHATQLQLLMRVVSGN